MSKEAALAFATGAQAPAKVANTANPIPQEGGQLAVLAELATPTTPATTPPPEMESSFVVKKLKWEQDRIHKELELKRDRDELIAAQKTLQEFNQKKQMNPIEAIKMLGLTEADLFNYAAEVAPPELTAEEKMIQTAEQAAEAKFKAYEEARLAEQKSLQEKNDSQALEAFTKSIGTHFESNKDKYKYSASVGEDPTGLALAFVSEVFKKSGGQEIISIEEALAQTEEYYKTDWLERSARLNPAPPPAQTPPEGSQMTKKEPERTRTVTPAPGTQAPNPTIHKSRTLSNGATATLASATQKQESFSEKRARIIQDIVNGRLERYSK